MVCNGASPAHGSMIGFTEILTEPTTSTSEGGISAPLADVPDGTDTTPGREATDYTSGTFTGRIALIS